VDPIANRKIVRGEGEVFETEIRKEEKSSVGVLASGSDEEIDVTCKEGVAVKGNGVPPATMNSMR
jgi:hypothetical protein